MTSHAGKRCRHCQVRYYYQASGWGAPEYNHPDWCPDCYKVVVEALREVPPRVEKVFVPTDEVTAFELETLENERWEATKAAGKLPVRRVAAPLFDMVDPSNTQQCGITRKDGVTYRWSYWSKDPEGTAEVKKEMERDLATGEEVPWVGW